jgi:ABC-type transport system involved in multi-copper enzyme maturation permease subunit
VNIHKQELAKAEGGAGLNQAAISGYKLDKPPTPLSVIVEGMEGAAGKYSTVNILSIPTLEGGSGGDPMFAYFGTLDVMYIVRVVLSLVAILLTYDAVSGEREQGTLKLALSNSVPRATVLLAKCVGGYITLLLPFLVPLLIGLLILITSGSINFMTEDWNRLALISLSAFLYIGIFLMLGLFVSSRTNRSTTALMMLLFIWVVVVLAVPKVSMIVAGKIRDVPSVQEVQGEKDTVMAQILKEGQEKTQQYFQEHRGEMQSPETRAEVMDGFAKIQEEVFNSITRRKGQIEADYEGKKAAQFRLASRLSRISPASVYTYASTGLARTGFDRQERFLKAARIYQTGFVQYFNELMAKIIKASQTDEEAAQKMKFDLDQLPTLDFREASLSESWNSVWVDFLILFLLIVCFFMIAYVGFVRSDVR